jgi:hypothetical protein
MAFLPAPSRGLLMEVLVQRIALLAVAGDGL